MSDAKELINREYKYGFVTSVESDTIPRGLSDETIRLISENKIKKGNVLTTAELAGIMAAKKTSELIPLCHPLMLSKVDLQSKVLDESIEVESKAICIGKTGVEMEALTAVSVALLTIYDMCKAVDKTMVISGIELIEKTKSFLTEDLHRRV